MTDLKEYEKLKNNILSLYNGGPGKVLMIAGAVSKEGCSTVASNVASIFTDNGSLRILLIDGNLRNPSIHKTFNLDNEKGLSDLIMGNATMDEVIKETTQRNLSVITAGMNTGNPADIFEVRKLKEIITSLKERADYLIFDSPPVNAYPETHVLSSQMDGVILVVHAGRTRWEIVQKAKQQLESANARVLGVILNRKKHVIPAFIYNRL